jgi:hypothetical protein
MGKKYPKPRVAGEDQICGPLTIPNIPTLKSNEAMTIGVKEG